MKRDDQYTKKKKEKRYSLLLLLIIISTSALFLIANYQPQNINLDVKIPFDIKKTGTIWITVPTNKYQNINYQPSYWIPILKELNIDGVIVSFGGEWFWWKNIDEARSILEQYKNAGFLVMTEWDHHGGYGPENNC